MFSGRDVRLKETIVGETVHLLCGKLNGKSYTLNHSVNWQYRPSSSSNAHRIISGDRGGRLVINGTMLMIFNVNATDRGIYKCFDEHLWEIYKVVLDVKGKF